MNEKGINITSDENDGETVFLEEEEIALQLSS